MVEVGRKYVINRYFENVLHLQKGNNRERAYLALCIVQVHWVCCCKKERAMIFGDKRVRSFGVHSSFLSSRFADEREGKLLRLCISTPMSVSANSRAT